MRASLVIGAVMAVLLGCAPDAAEEEGRGDAGRIAVIAESCANCHGTEARLETDIPRLAGEDAAILRARLLAFKRGEAEDGTVMPRLAAGFSEAELEALAEHFAAKDTE